MLVSTGNLGGRGKEKSKRKPKCTQLRIGISSTWLLERKIKLMSWTSWVGCGVE
jgi:hypothetical protein